MTTARRSGPPLPWRLGARQLLGAFAAAALVVGVACRPVGPPAPPPPPAPSCSASASTQPLSTGAAEARAAEAFRHAHTRIGRNVPLVTVEQTASSARVETHPVGSAAAARAVARDAADGHDLVTVAVAQPVHIDTVASDPLRGQQWALNVTTFEQAWSTTTGTGVEVGVVDTGVGASHPDLVGQVLSGAEFLNNTGVDSGDGRVDPYGHGTHVSGIVAAATNNGVGVAGAAPGARVLPVRVLDASGSGWDADVARGIDWAVDRGARVVNLSLGGSDSSVIDAAVTYARSHGAVVVAAAGNNGDRGNAPSYPGASPGALAVAAVDSNLAHGSFSNTGCYVKISAPGVNVLSTVPAATYQSWSGTSMATPFASATAALVLAAHPVCTPDGVASRIESSAQPLGGSVPNAQFGYGLVDPARALSVAGC